MKKISVSVFLIFLLCSLHAQNTRYILSNGMEVYISPLSASPVVSAELCIRGGFCRGKRERRIYWYKQKTFLVQQRRNGKKHPGNRHYQYCFDTYITCRHILMQFPCIPLRTGPEPPSRTCERLSFWWSSAWYSTFAIQDWTKRIYRFCLWYNS